MSTPWHVWCTLCGCTDLAVVAIIAAGIAVQAGRGVRRRVRALRTRRYRRRVVLTAAQVNERLATLIDPLTGTVRTIPEGEVK